MPDARTALALCLFSLPAVSGRSAAADGGPPAIEVRSGRVSTVDWADRRVSLLGPGGRFDLGFDRNTVVYLPGRLGTMRDVASGVEARAAVGPDGLAAWIEVRPPPRDGGAPAGPDGGAPTGSGAGPPPGSAGAAPDLGASAGADGGTRASARPDGGAPR